jgi:hypothetical protein
MDIYGKIREKLVKISGGSMPLIFPAAIESIDGETCSVRLAGELVITGVRLRAVINDNADRLLITPRTGSYVLVADLSNGNYRSLAVVAYSEIDSVEINIDKSNIVIDKAGMTVEREGENLLDALSDFIDEVSKIIVLQGTSPNVPALNAIKMRLNKIMK